MISFCLMAYLSFTQTSLAADLEKRTGITNESVADKVFSSMNTPSVPCGKHALSGLRKGGHKTECQLKVCGSILVADLEMIEAYSRLKQKIPVGSARRSNRFSYHPPAVH